MSMDSSTINRKRDDLDFDFILLRYRTSVFYCHVSLHFFHLK